MEAKIGILMLNTVFERPVGDIGNPNTFSFPVCYEKVEQALITRVIIENDGQLQKRFVAAAKRLERQGVRAITTSCGFLAIHQKTIMEKLHTPFFSSSLLQIPLIKQMTGGPVGVITARKDKLTATHLQAVNVEPDDVAIVGMDEMPAFSGAIIAENQPLQQQEIASEMKQVTTRLIDMYPDITAIVLECTNMPPYKRAIREVTDLPIFDIVTFVNYIYETF